MHELRLANLVRHFDFELDRVAGEALAEVAIDGSVGFSPSTSGIRLPMILLGVRPSAPHSGLLTNL